MCLCACAPVLFSLCVACRARSVRLVLFGSAMRNRESGASGAGKSLSGAAEVIHIQWVPLPSGLRLLVAAVAMLNAAGFVRPSVHPSFIHTGTSYIKASRCSRGS